MATSNFMIARRGQRRGTPGRAQIGPIIVAPVAIGVLAGSVIGARDLRPISSATLRLVFVAVLAVAVEMLQRWGVQLMTQTTTPRPGGPNRSDHQSTRPTSAAS